eukprot:752819-Hanusia_phi.AAC.7
MGVGQTDANISNSTLNASDVNSSSLNASDVNSSTLNASDVNSSSLNASYFNMSNASNASWLPAGEGGVLIDSIFSASWFLEPLDDIPDCNFTWTSLNATKNHSTLQLNESSMTGSCSWILEASNESIVSFIVHEFQGANVSGCDDFLLVETCVGLACSSWELSEKICASSGGVAKAYHTGEGGRMRVTLRNEESVASSFTLIASWIESSVHVGRLAVVYAHP